MEFGIKKCAILLMKSRKAQEGIELWNQKSIKTLVEEENLGILETDTIKQAEIKGKNVSPKNEKGSWNKAL